MFAVLWKKNQIGSNLKNAAGDDIPTDQQAEAMATHLEQKQWYVREDCDGFQRHALFNTELDTNNGDITLLEICSAIKKLRNNKAAGIDEITAELWKIIAKDADALQSFVTL